MSLRKSDAGKPQWQIDNERAIRRDERVIRRGIMAGVAAIVLVPSIMIGVGLWLKPPEAELKREYAAQLARSVQPDCPTQPPAKTRVYQTTPKL
jgi:hypothetical protein